MIVDQSLVKKLRVTKCQHLSILSQSQMLKFFVFISLFYGGLGYLTCRAMFLLILIEFFCAIWKKKLLLQITNIMSDTVMRQDLLLNA